MYLDFWQVLSTIHVPLSCGALVLRMLIGIPSFLLPEVLGMSDRIMVVREGEVRGILDGKDADQAKIMTLATGGSL